MYVIFPESTCFWYLYKILVLNILFTFVYVSQHNTTKMVLLQFRSWVVKNKGFLGVIHVCALFLHTYYCGYIFVSSS